MHHLPKKCDLVSLREIGHFRIVALSHKDAVTMVELMLPKVQVAIGILMNQVGIVLGFRCRDPVTE